ncbi:type IV secretory system conjugative DNA transfer family protein [Tardiphaga sp. 215_C5_N2_1]|uniref:type IV secretory system conjugative DNA transfer family protein n=1 Tax=Tardiphaga sp. 215_C5_N2_1 TaxID=3240774 RepID=UPI003F8968CC
MARTFPPRGTGIVGAKEQAPSRVWANAKALGHHWDDAPGKISLGVFEGRIIAEPDRPRAPKGSGDDRNIVTLAASRAGKSSSVLIPQLKRYLGSVLVIDPKGELARLTADYRSAVLKQNVAILDPFGVSGWQSSSYNPFDELDSASDTYVDDVALVADALIIDAEKDRHWTDSAKNLVRGIILYMALTGECSLPRMYEILLGAEGSLMSPGKDDNLNDFFFVRMAAKEGFDGRVALIGQSFLDKSERELSSVLSTAREQLAFLHSRPLAKALKSSSLRLKHLKSAPTTIYLCLPVTRLATHARWLRLIVTLTLIEMERDQTIPRHPVLLMLEEFAALGYMRPIEYAAGFMAGFGVRLWTILQDLSQLKTHFPKSWETFLGNAGILQTFAGADITTTEYISKLLGNTRIVDSRDVFVSGEARGQGDIGRRDHVENTRLLDPGEISHYFARETNRQLIIVPGQPPICLDRFEPEPRR